MPIVADMSSNILSRPIDVSQYGVQIDSISTSEIVISCIVREEDGPKAE